MTHSKSVIVTAFTKSQSWGLPILSKSLTTLVLGNLHEILYGKFSDIISDIINFHSTYVFAAILELELFL